MKNEGMAEIVICSFKVEFAMSAKVCETVCADCACAC